MQKQWAPLKSSSPYSRAFTIVELLIVVVVIAILASIVIISYNGISQRAKQSAAASAAEQAAKAVLNFATLNAEVFPTTLPAAGVSNDTNTTYEYAYNNTAKTYCITATFQSVSYYISNASPNPVAGVCPGHLGGGPVGPWTDIAAGSEHSCGIYQGLAYCWGRDYNGALGTGTAGHRLLPTAVSTAGVLAGKTVTDIDAGPTQSCAVADGAAYCWGDNSDGEVGDGTTTNRSTPTAVSTAGVLGGKTVTRVDVGANYACALANGAVYCWGSDGYAGLGNGAGGSSTTPVAVDTSGVLSGKTITSIHAGWRSACAIATDGKAYCWGTSSYGAVGNDPAAGAASPVQIGVNGVLAGKTVTATGGGEFNGCAVASGAAYCWGNGALGNNSYSGSTIPVAVDVSGVLAGKTVTDASIGGQGCVVASGAAYCWGSNTNGSLGNGTNTDSPVPVAVSTAGVLAGKTVTKISTDYYGHTCALASGQAYCWGNGGYGRLGNNVGSSSNIPVQVTNP